MMAVVPSGAQGAFRLSDDSQRAVLVHALRIRQASKQLRNERDLVLGAIKQNGLRLQYASDELKNDRNIVLAAVSRQGDALQYASSERRRDREIVMKAVAQNGFALRFASRSLRSDTRVCVAALDQAGARVVRYFSTERRGNRELILQAAKQSGQALKYASEDLRSDVDFCLRVGTLDPSAFQYAAASVKLDKLFQDKSETIVKAHQKIKQRERSLVAAPSLSGTSPLAAAAPTRAANFAANDAGELSPLSGKHRSRWVPTLSYEASLSSKVVSSEGESHQVPSSNLLEEDRAPVHIPSMTEVTSQHTFGDATLNESPPGASTSSSGLKSQSDILAQCTGHASSNSIVQTDDHAENVSELTRGAAPQSPTLDSEQQEPLRECLLHTTAVETCSLNSAGSNSSFQQTIGFFSAGIRRRLTFPATPNRDAASTFATGSEIVSPSSALPKSSTTVAMLALSAFGGPNGKTSGLVAKFATKLKATVSEHRHSPLQNASPDTRRDKSFVLEACKRSGLALQFASLELRGDPEVVMVACESHGGALRYATAELRSDRNFVLQACSQGQHAAIAASHALGGLQDDRSFWDKAVAGNPLCLAFAPVKLKADRELVLMSVTKSGRELYYAAESLRDDKEIVFAAIENDVSALSSATLRLRGDRSVVIKALRIDGSSIRWASQELRDDIDIVMEAITNSWWAVGHASDAAIRFVLDNVDLIFELNRSMKKDKSINPSMTDPTSSLMQLRRKLHHKLLLSSKAVMLTVVKIDGRALRLAALHLRADEEVVRVALNSNALGSVPFASAELRRDRAFMLDAVKRDGGCLRYCAADWLLRDRDLIDAAQHQAAAAQASISARKSRGELG